MANRINIQDLEKYFKAPQNPSNECHKADMCNAGKIYLGNAQLVTSEIVRTNPVYRNKPTQACKNSYWKVNAAYPVHTSKCKPPP